MYRVYRGVERLEGWLEWSESARDKTKNEERRNAERGEWEKGEWGRSYAKEKLRKGGSVTDGGRGWYTAYGVRGTTRKQRDDDTQDIREGVYIVKGEALKGRRKEGDVPAFCTCGPR